MTAAWISALRACIAAGCCAASGTLWAADAGAPPASAPRPITPAHVSPYTRARLQHAQDAASAPAKVNPLMQHRPRMPTSLRHG